MLDENTFEFWQDKTVVDLDGEKIGTIDDLYLDDATDQREWLIVDTGFFGRNAVVPVGNVTHLDDRTVQVPFSKQQVKDSPHIEADGELSEQDERVLYDYYGISFSDQSSPSLLYDEGVAGPRSTGTSGTIWTTDTRDIEREPAMTRSEEELSLRKERRPRELVRLRKPVRTEPVLQTIPVQREEVVVEREPITDENRDLAMQGLDITENVHEGVLSDEEVIAEKRVEPKERIRLDKQTVTGEETVSDELRKEDIDVEREDRGHRAA